MENGYYIPPGRKRIGSEADGMVIRKEYPQIPPKVEYSLTDKAKTLLPILEKLFEWGIKNQDN
ncbi:DNA-binding HxlR family transcriptional regulator [Cytobacillus horneckiae]